MAFTKEQAAKQGWIACPPIREVVGEYLDDARREMGASSCWQLNDGGIDPVTRLASCSGVSADLIYRIVGTDKAWVEFDTADKLVCHSVGADQWLLDDRLRDVYLDFDLSHLDLQKPTSPDSDGLLTLAEILPVKQLAALWGVSGPTMYRHVNNRREAVVA